MPVLIWLGVGITISSGKQEFLCLSWSKSGLPDIPKEMKHGCHLNREDLIISLGKQGFIIKQIKVAWYTKIWNDGWYINRADNSLIITDLEYQILI